MLTTVRAVLEELNLAKAAAPAVCNVNFANRDPLYQIFLDAETSFVVKVSALPSLLGEFQNQRDGFTVLGHCVPEPLGFRTVEGLGFLVCRGRRHAELTLAGMERLGDSFVGGVRRYLELAAGGFRLDDSPLAHSVTARKLVDGYAGAPFHAVLDEWLDGPAGAWLDALPQVRQHGDFCLNNIGVDGRQLVVFDWEDFGRVTLPGFDVVVLAASSLGLDHARLDALLATDKPRPLGILVHELRRRLGVDRKAFRRYALLCLVTFLNLKERFYGPGIVAQVRSLADGLAERCR